MKFYMFEAKAVCCSRWQRTVQLTEVNDRSRCVGSKMVVKQRWWTVTLFIWGRLKVIARADVCTGLWSCFCNCSSV
jgi:hypothetical protein